MNDTITNIKAELNPTESSERLEKAIKNMCGEIVIKNEKIRGEIYLTANLDTLENLKTFHDVLARERIREAVRMMLSRWASKDEGVSFNLNRQAAFAGHVSIYHANKAPLGPIQVKIVGDPEEIINYLCGKKYS